MRRDAGAAESTSGVRGLAPSRSPARHRIAEFPVAGNRAARLAVSGHDRLRRPRRTLPAGDRRRDTGLLAGELPGPARGIEKAAVSATRTCQLQSLRSARETPKPAPAERDRMDRAVVFLGSDQLTSGRVRSTAVTMTRDRSQRERVPAAIGRPASPSSPSGRWAVQRLRPGWSRCEPSR